MLGQAIKNLSKQRQILGVTQRGFAISNHSLDDVLRDPHHANWGKFFQGVKPGDLADADSRSVGRLLQVLSHASHSAEAAQQTELYNAIDEYFRKNFRKLSAKDAIEIIVPLGENMENKLSVLDEKFWVWETLDEAIRPAIKDLSAEETGRIAKGFAANYKGSKDLWDFITIKINREVASLW